MSQQNTQLAPAPEAKLSAWMDRADVSQRIESALDGVMDTQTFIAQMLIYIEQKPDLAVCSVQSKFAAIHQCALMGLLPGSQQVALIPRKIRDNGQVVRVDVTVMPQWQGFKSLMERHPDVHEVVPTLVANTDDFVAVGDGDDMVVARHTFDPLNHDITEANLRGGYVKVLYRDGRPPRFFFVSREYILKCRECSESYTWEQKDLRAGKKDVKPSVWTVWFDQQARKTLLRACYSRRIVPMDSIAQRSLDRVLKHEDALLGNDPRIIQQPSFAALPTSAAANSAPRLTRSEQLSQQINAPTPAATTEEPPTLEPVGEVVEREPEPAKEEPRRQSALVRYLDEAAKADTDESLTAIYDRYAGPEATEDCTDEERSEIGAAYTAEKNRRYAANKTVPARPAGRQQQKLVQ